VSSLSANQVSSLSAIPSSSLSAIAGNTWPAPRVVALMPGSLPMGGVVPDTPIWAFEQPAPALAMPPEADAGLRPQRTDIELGGLQAFTLSDVVTPAEADAIVAASEHFGYREEAPGISTPPGMRMNKSVHWVAERPMMDAIFRRIGALLPPEIDGMPLAPRLSERINMYRYDDGDVFNRHTDGDWPGYGLSDDRSQMVQWVGVHSALTMLLYLNGPEDRVQGGCTRLFRPDGSFVDVTPTKGSALFFRHGFGPGSVVHVGARVSGPVPKYVARINVMVQPPGVPRRMRVQAD
jgi:2OG-Fe(II) oxygenase superfamily